MWASAVPMARTRTGKQDTIMVTGHGARAAPAWASRWYATCPAMPSAKEQIADHLANRRVRPLIEGSRASQARSAYASTPTLPNEHGVNNVLTWVFTSRTCV